MFKGHIKTMSAELGRSNGLSLVTICKLRIKGGTKSEVFSHSEKVSVILTHEYISWSWGILCYRKKMKNLISILI